MSKVPDAWDDEWSTAADDQATVEESEPKKLTSKQTKAQRRAQQAEFNRQLWAEAEGPKQTNFFLESRNVVPLRQEFKPAPVLLSRKGPIIQKARPPTEDVNKLSLKDDSSEDDEDPTIKKQTIEQRQAQAAKEREEKQRKYEERRLELFGPTNAGVPNNKSGGSSPSLTPPGSRSTTPNRGGKRGRRGNTHIVSNQSRGQKELFDHNYSPKPESTLVMKRQQPSSTNSIDILPVREPKGPDGSGRGGAGFTSKGRRIFPGEPSPAQPS